MEVKVKVKIKHTLEQAIKAQMESRGIVLLPLTSALVGVGVGGIKSKGKGNGHPCTGTETLYRPYGP